jgi:predicted nucleic acid-binding protein
MKRCFIDTNVVVRFLTGEPPEMARQARGLFQAVDHGELTLVIPEIVIAETVWVLHSYYEIPREEIRKILGALITHSGLEVPDRLGHLSALSLFADQNLDYADALLAVKMRQDDVLEIYSFDQHFDRISGITRLVPG